MTGYISEMRKLVGHRPILQCGASTIIVGKDGRVLLQKRADNGLWGYHGGSVELDEDVQRAAERELFEETGLTALSMELLGVFSGPDMHFTYPNGDEVSNVDIVFVCRSFVGEPIPQDGEVIELRYFSEEEITDEMISSPNLRALRTFFAKQNRNEAN